MADQLTQIQQRIFTIRDTKVMLDSDLAELYEVEARVLNQAVKRNINRFLEDFMFRLTKKEFSEVITNCDHNSLCSISKIPAPNFPNKIK
jgi:hypothetical protein